MFMGQVTVKVYKFYVSTHKLLVSTHKLLISILLTQRNSQFLEHLEVSTIVIIL